MAMFLVLPALILLCVVLLAPLMLPGALVVGVALLVANAVVHHHEKRAAHLH